MPNEAEQWAGLGKHPLSPQWRAAVAGLFTEPQKQFLRWLNDPDAPRLCFFQGDTGCGKTMIVSFGVVGHSLARTGHNYLLTGTTVGAVQRNVEPEIGLACGTLGVQMRPVRSRQTLGIGANTFHEFGAPTTKTATRTVRGANALVGVVDEATLTDEAFFDEVVSRCRTGDDIRVITTFNPDHPSSWVKTKYIDGDPSRREYIVGTLRESCELGIMPWSYYEMLDSTLTGARRKRFLLGQWAAEEGLCFPSIEEVATLGLPFDRVEAGVDWGTRNPTAAVFMGRVKGSNPERWETVGEYYWNKGERTVSAHAEGILSLGAQLGCRVYRVDPSAVALRKEMRAKGGKNVKKARNDVLDGIDRVETMAHNGNLLVTNRAPNLLREAAAYIWDSDEKRDAPVKRDDHACDALRYWRRPQARPWKVHQIA